jgi:hypothetical protein
MSVKRAFGVLTFAVAAGAIGSAVIVGTSASGASAPEAGPEQPSVAAPPALVPEQQAVPNTTLHLPTTIRLLDRTISATPINSSHLILNGTLSKKRHAAGGVVFTCTTSSGRITSCLGAFALSGGVLVAKVAPQTASDYRGVITGGTGTYSGASGTVKLIGSSSTTARLTIKYSVG